MATPVTDPALLAQLNAPDPKDRVTDPALIAALEGTAAPAAAPAAPEPKSTLQTIREAIHAPTRALENGAFLGLGDRARASIDAILSAGGYGQHLKDEQGDTAQFAAAHPVASPVLEAFGGAGAPAAVVGAAAKGATLGAKTLLGAGTGGMIGALQGAAASKDWTDLPQVAKDTAIGGGVGTVIGGALPGTAAAVGAAYRNVANAMRGSVVDGMSRGASGHLIKAVEADGPAAVQARLAQLGPDAMLGDAGPALLGKLQGSVLNSDEGRSIGISNLKARDLGTDARINADVEKAIGPYHPEVDDPQTVTNTITAHRKDIDNVNYPAALDNAPPVKIAPIMTDLIDRIDQTPRGSMVHKALTNLQDMLTKKTKQPVLDAGGYPVYDKLGNEKWQEVPSSHDSAQILHEVKGELDNIIEYDMPGLGVPAGALQRQQGALKQMRGAINSALEEQVPGYANANAVSAALARRGEAVNAGTHVLSGGDTAPSPGRFSAEFAQREPGEQIALAKGLRGTIERILGQNPNDLVALRRQLQGGIGGENGVGGGWNTARIATVYGQPAANELDSTVTRNTAFRDTHTKVSEGSQTDLRNAARKEMRPDPSTDTPLINPNSTLTGFAATAAKKGVQAVANALIRSDPTRHYGEVARALTEQGAARDARLVSIVQALNARQGNAATASTAGNIGAVVAALLGKAGADELRNSPMRRRQ